MESCIMFCAANVLVYMKITMEAYSMIFLWPPFLYEHAVP